MIPGVIDSSGGRILEAFSDAFTRANSTTISTATNKWQELRGDWEISSNRLATATAPNTNPIAVVQTNTKNAQVQIGQGSSGFGWGVAFWAVDADNYYVAVTEMAVGNFTFYTCPTDTNITNLVGTTCTYPADYGATGNTTYSCPSGGTLSGTTCVFPANYAATASTGYGSYDATATNTYSCVGGLGPNLIGTNCYLNGVILDNISDTVTAGCANTTADDGIYLAGCGCFGNEIGDGATCTCYSDGIQPDPIFGCAFHYAWPYFFAGTCWANARSGCVYYTTSQYTFCFLGTDAGGGNCLIGPADVTTTYSCPSGGTLDGNQCHTSSTTYSCPSGGTLSGTTCVFPDDYAATATTTYSCPSGGTLSGTTCVFPADYAATANTGTNYSHTVILKRSLASTVTTIATSSAVVTSSSTARPSYVRVNTSGEAITISAPLDNSAGTMTLSYTATGALLGKKHGVALSSVSATVATNVDNFEYQPV